MSKEEVKSYFDFERKKHFDFFLPYYKKRNWLVLKDNIGINQVVDWDVKLKLPNDMVILVDEKARQKEYNDFLVEIMQDIETGRLGWFYGEKDFILYGSWIDIEAIDPSSLYLISSKDLRKYICTIDGSVKTRLSKLGWGNTWNLSLEWESLINKGVVKKLI